MRKTIVAALLVSTFGCEVFDETTPPIDTPPIDTTPPTNTPPGQVCAATHAGRYAADGVWNLSGPINEQRTLGAMVADLVVEETVKRLGVPSAAEDEARDALSALVHEPIRDGIDGSATGAAISQDPFIVALRGASANVHVQSEIVLSGNGAGREDLSLMAVDHDGSRHEMERQIAVAANWSGDRNSNTLSVDDHEFSLRYGEFLLWLIEDVVGAQEHRAFEDRVMARAQCGTIVSTLGDSNSEIGLTVLSVGYAVTETEMTGICDSVALKIAQKVLGALEIDSGIIVGGDVRLSDADCDGRVDGLQSVVGYGGLLRVMGPDAIQPRIGVDFHADVIE